MTLQQIQTIRTREDLFRMISQIRQKRATIGCVPTMGALHEGHLSLVRESKQQCDFTVVSIFVNPTQFSPDEDLDQYPRPLDNDLQLLQQEGVDLVFLPDNLELYPADCSTSIKPPLVAGKLEGESRPTHFAGVATVVLKLLNLTQCDSAYFGQKDYQQVKVVQHLVRDLNHPCNIVMCPIARAEDGLALSSRNIYLSAEERQIATCLNRTLQETLQMITEGETDGRAIMAHMTQALIEGGVTETDYAVIADAESLEFLEQVSRPAVLLVAAMVGETRLIDNCLIT